MNIDTARMIAARVWCDPDMAHVAIDETAAERIAVILSQLDDTYANMRGTYAMPEQWVVGEYIVETKLRDEYNPFTGKTEPSGVIRQIGTVAYTTEEENNG